MSDLLHSQRQFPRGDGKPCLKEDQESAMRRAEDLWTERSLQASGQGCAVPLGVRKHSMIWELQTTH